MSRRHSLGEVAVVKDLIGLTFYFVKAQEEDEEVYFVGAGDTPTYRFFHEQSCCEQVRVAEVIGDVQDLVGVPILDAREDTQAGDNEYGSATWTFYNFRTIKGSVTIRWLGESNGYYGEQVDFERMPTEFEELMREVTDEEDND